MSESRLVSTPLRALRLVAACVVAVAPAGAQEHEGAPDTQLIVQDVHVSSYPGYELNATLTLPVAAGPAPAALVLTDPVQSGVLPELVERAVRALGEAGVATLRLDLTLPDGPVTTEGGAAPGADAYAAIQYLRGREDVDGDRIAVIGAGGAADAAVEAAVMDAAVRALVLLAPVQSAAVRSARDGALPLLIQPAPEPARLSSVNDTIARFLVNALN